MLAAARTAFAARSTLLRQRHAASLLASSSSRAAFSSSVEAQEPGPRRGEDTPKSFSALRDDPTNESLGLDVRDLGKLVGSAITLHNGTHTLQTVEKLRKLAIAWRSEDAGSEADVAAMAQVVSALEPEKLLEVSRAFAHFLALSNAAEGAHRLRRLRSKTASGTDTGSNALPPVLESCGGTIDAIVAEDGGDASGILRAIASQQVELVLTAHPTEVHRRTFLLKHRAVTEALLTRDELRGNPMTTPYDLAQCNRRLEREVVSGWGSDEIRRIKPTPGMEARGGLAVVEFSLWHALPSFLRRLDAVLQEKLGAGLPLEASPVKFASWMGGDRDGNPNVTADVTRQVLRDHRARAAALLREDLEYLRLDLSVTRATPELRSLLKPEHRGSPEPYKMLVQQLQQDLENHASGTDLATGGSAVRWHRGTCPTTAMAQALRAAHASLTAVGHAELADGRLVDTIRRIQAFGLYLLPLDIRQESTRHAEAVGAVASLAGQDGYTEWDEDKRVAWLSAELAQGRPLLPRGAFDDLPALEVTPNVRDVLETVDLISQTPPGALGAYVISQARSASDVLAVELLQQEAGVRADGANRMRVVPLFETLDDLTSAAATLDRLFSAPGYAERSGRRQEVMVGYSDSAKDAGRIAATWAQHTSQEEMRAVADKHGFELVFFHGKGGTVGRGGNPALYDGILGGHPDRTIRGKFRVTEQGEMITHNFGTSATAERTLDVMTAAVLRDHFVARPEVKAEWRGVMSELSETSCDAFRALVHKEPRFVEYFRTATPERELGMLNVGSRPAKRNPKGGVESLRAIPWIFAWAQTRLNLPAWLGVGDCLRDGMSKPETAALLKEMHAEWPWFRSNMDLIEMLLSKSEPAIAAHYDRVLVLGDEADEDGDMATLGRELRSRLAETEEAVLAVTGTDSVDKSGSKLLQRSLRLRNPYVDVLNVCQVEALRRMRAQHEKEANQGASSSSSAAAADDGTREDKQQQQLTADALLVTINGIASGMRNSG